MNATHRLARQQRSTTDIPLWTRLQGALFAPIVSGPRPRSAGDVVQIVLAVLTCGALAAISALGFDVDSTAWHYPQWIKEIVKLVADLGLIVVPLGIVVLAVAGRRWLATRDVLIAVAGQILIVALLVGTSMPALIVLAAVAAVATIRPYLDPIVHRRVVVLLTVAILAWMLIWSHSWCDTGIAVLLGTIAANAVRLALGIPMQGSQAKAIPDLTSALGITVSDVVPHASGTDDEHWSGWDGQVFDGTGPDGPVRVTLLSKDAARGRLLSGVWESFWYKNTGRPSWNLSPHQLLQSRTGVLVWARSADVEAPELLAAGVAGPAETSILVTSAPRLPSLRDTADAGGTVSADHAAAVWTQLNRLHEAQIAHGSIGPDTVHVDADSGEAHLSDFVKAETLADDRRLTEDRVATIITLAQSMGVDAAVAATVAAVDRDSLVATLPLFQNAALPKALREHTVAIPGRKTESVVADCRSALATALSIDAPELAPLRRFTWSKFFLVVFSAIGAYMLVAQFAGLDNVGETFASANWWWVAVAGACMLAMMISQAWSMTGAVLEHVPLSQVLLLRWANYFTGLIGGTVASAATSIRFFQRKGIEPTAAVTAGLLTSVTGFVAQLTLSIVSLFFVAGQFSAQGASDSSSDSGSINWWLIIVVVLAVVTLVGLVLAVPRLRSLAKDKLLPPLKSGLHNLRVLANEPRRIVALFGGGILALCFQAFTMWSSLHAFGASATIPAIILVLVLAAWLGGISPVPGGMGVMEAGLIAGLTTLGIDPAVATATVLVYRMITCYLPPVWGWACMVILGKRELL